MKTNMLIKTFAAAAFAISSSSAIADGQYFKLGGSYSVSNSGHYYYPSTTTHYFKSQKAPGVIGAFGMNFCDTSMRADLSVNQTFGKNKYTTAYDDNADGSYGYVRTDSTIALASVYYDVSMTDSLKPYFGAGAGMIRTNNRLSMSIGTDSDSSSTVDSDEYTTTVTKSNKNRAAFAAHIGAMYNFTQNTGIDLQYTYLRTGRTAVVDTTNSATYRGPSGYSVGLVSLVMGF